MLFFVISVTDRGYEVRRRQMGAAHETDRASGATGYLGVNRPRVAGFPFGREGDERRLARDEIPQVRGRTLVFRLGTDTRGARPYIHSISPSRH